MSSLPYVQQLSKVIVAQITQTIGWNSIQTTPLELLSDILHKFLEELTRQTQRYTELYGRTEPNLDDVALAFNDLNINIADLEEYISNVDSVPCIVNVPKFPIPKESNLNFLKPGSKEVVTRPVHIHEHLPPIQPHEETPPAPAEVKPVIEPRPEDDVNSAIQTYMSTNQISDTPILDSNGVFGHETHDDGSEAINVVAETTVVENNSNIPADEAMFRKPFDAPPPPPSSASAQSASRPNSETAANKDAIGKPTREIVSCFMTTGGFISPAREGKLPDARKPIIIQEDPEPKPIEMKPPTPNPELIERKHHSNKRDNKNDIMDTSKPYGNDMNHNDGAYADDGNGKEVKLYEVVQTVPDALPKKKTKKSQLAAAQMKEQKKLKKFNSIKQLKANRNQQKMNANAGGLSFADHFNRNDGLGVNPLNSEKMKKKLHKVEMLKKKHKQKQLGGALHAYAANENPLQEKQRKKRMSKLSKKNLQAMGLNPNAIEGFAIPPTPIDAMNYSIHDPTAKALLHDDDHMRQKESLKKMKQLQKLSTEPDKQKIKFFKKLQSTSSNLLSKTNDDPHDRLMADPAHLPVGDLNHHPYIAAGADYPDGENLNLSPGSGNPKLAPPNLDDLPPSKKMKLLKKLNKPPKEPKTPKIKKVKKDPLLKKQRTPKTPKILDQSIDVAKAPSNLEENPLTKMFRLDECRQNAGLLDQFPMPGLNPLNPLFQSVRFDFPARDQMQNYPFAPGLQNFDLAHLSRFKRPNFNDHAQNDAENMAKHPLDGGNMPPKPLCNVAPLMPPSLLNMEMQPKDGYAAAQSMNEPHSSQKHYQESPNTSFAPKKSVSFHNPEPYSDQSYGTDKRDVFDSPIVINSDDDDRHRSNASQSPNPDQDASFSGTEVKRKKVKDKKDKEKKEKKDKETGVVKLKKKKDKKDKSKNKGEHSKSPKDKAALKKEKREKKKERERSAAALLDANDNMGSASNPFYSAQGHSEWPRDAFSKDTDHSQISDRSDLNVAFNADNSNLEASTSIPKLTLKLAPSSSSPSSRASRPSTPDFPANKKSSKKKKKQWRTMDDDSEMSDAEDTAGTSGRLEEQSEQMTRESSPELARISALITRPPKQKSSNKQQAADFSSPVQNEYFDATATNRTDYHSSIANTTPVALTPSGRGRPKGSSSLKGSKSKASKASAAFTSTEAIKKSQIIDSQPAIADAQASILHTVDEQASEENQVWICPACGRVDDGTPMIGCDGCDDWYHWVCVGILVPPKEDQDWFCRVCISRKQEDKDKKKKRKKKDKKDH